MPDAALTALWTEFAVPIRAFVRRRVPAEVDADDVVQDVFLRIVRHADQLAAIDDLEAWIFRIARTALGDALRGAQRRRARASDVDLATIATAVEPGDADAMRELLPCLLPFLRQLPEPYRRALEMTAMEGLTQHEAAAVEQISVSGMKSRVQRAREQLRREFQRCCAVQLDGRGHVMNVESRCADDACAPAASFTPIQRLPK